MALEQIGIKARTIAARSAPRCARIIAARGERGAPPPPPSVLRNFLRCFGGAFDQFGHPFDQFGHWQDSWAKREPVIFSTCLALRRAQQIEREVSEAEEARAACAHGHSLHSRSPKSSGVDTYLRRQFADAPLRRECGRQGAVGYLPGEWSVSVEDWGDGAGADNGASALVEASKRAFR